MKKARLWVVCAFVASLGACGSDDDSPAPVAPLAAGDAIPDGVGRSAEGMVSWMAQLAAEDNDAKEALDVAKFTPPNSEADEPVALQ